jgi:hypothetical protein
MAKKNPPPSEEWQPIATAPMDGTVIIVWPPTEPGRTSCARYNTGIPFQTPHWRRLDTRFPIESLRNPPTHWRPVLPGPGETSSNQE